MLRDNLVGLIEPMLSSAGAYPLALCTAWRKSSDDRPPCLENPRPAGGGPTLPENAASPFHAEPRHECKEVPRRSPPKIWASRVAAPERCGRKGSCPPQYSFSLLNIPRINRLFVYVDLGPVVLNSHLLPFMLFTQSISRCIDLTSRLLTNDQVILACPIKKRFRNRIGGPAILSDGT